MTGPATLMHNCLQTLRMLRDVLNLGHGYFPAALGDITPEQLAAMDAAAEILRLPLDDAESLMRLWSDLGGPEREEAALRQLLDRAVRRRKEGGA